MLSNNNKQSKIALEKKNFYSVTKLNVIIKLGLIKYILYILVQKYLIF